MNNSIRKKDVLNYGVLFGLYSSLLMYLGYVLSYESSPFYRIFSFAFAILILYHAIMKFKKQNFGHLKIKDAIKTGLAIGLVGGIIYAFYTYIHLSFINEEFLREVVDSIKNSTDTQGLELSDEEIAKRKEGAIDYYGSPFFYVTTNLVGSIFQALIVSLVIGLIKKNN
jgi:hypothetical protein